MKSSNYLYLIIGIISFIILISISNIYIIPQWIKYFLVVPIGYCIGKGFTKKELSHGSKTKILLFVTLGSLLSVFLTLDKSIHYYYVNVWKYPIRFCNCIYNY